jgi:hypothetical protein
MEARELIGYLLIVMAIALAAAGVWAVRHFSPGRVYSRKLRQERRARRQRTEAKPGE